MTNLPCLETKAFTAFVVDNAPLGIHRGGYNGIASLIPRQTGNNIFVPSYAGLNYETIHLPGLMPYIHASGSKFEPRCEAMHIDSSTATQVVLVQPATTHAQVRARITFRVEEPWYLHQRIELVFHRRFCAAGELNPFRSLWASYLHMPSDRHIYTQVRKTTGLAGWVGLTKEDHHAQELLVRPLPDDRELSVAEHLFAMQANPANAEPVAPQALAPMELPEKLSGPLSSYYGFCHDELLFLMLFRQPERFRLAYSPNGGGKQPEWCPAWDYVLHLDDAKLEQTYTWDLCLAVKPFRGRADVLAEIRRYRQG